MLIDFWEVLKRGQSTAEQLAIAQGKGVKSAAAHKE
jgi:hypothetical protein